MKHTLSSKCPGMSQIEDEAEEANTLGVRDGLV
jgi:hypothetical protein